ncbi:uncharacterized protein LOC134528549 isoform X1 [Bacillus rossius redtenbacheri]|uniref:uncharacterized protein LOC134528549 isoform X1 n=1 Tax=Bacillus rossius redtenbacheri TaxID=93214 RepID=UPI002FDEEFA3
MSEEGSDAEREAGSPEGNTAEQEQQLYSIANLSGLAESADDPDIRTDFQSFYPTSRWNKVSRLGVVHHILNQFGAAKQSLVTKVTDFGKGSAQNFIPLSISSRKKQRNSKRRKNFDAKKKIFKNVMKCGRQRSAVTPSKSSVGKTPAPDLEVIVLSDSDDCEGGVGKTVPELLLLETRSDCTSHQAGDVSSVPSDACRNETPVVDVAAAPLGDSEPRSSNSGVRNECLESDVEILPEPEKPAPPVIFLDSGDEIPAEEAANISLAGPDTGNCITMNKSKDVSKTSFENAVSDDCVMIDTSEDTSRILLANLDTGVTVVMDENLDVPAVGSSAVPSITNSDSAVAKCWTPAMIQFYNEPSGDQHFEHRTLQANMSKDRLRWATSLADVHPLSLGWLARRVRCSNCRQRGHPAARCPDPERVRACCLCSERTHEYSRCPNGVCAKCGACCFSFNKSGCRACRTRNVRCDHCSSEEHASELCPEVWRCYHHTTREVLANLGDHPAEQLKPDGEQNCPHCTRRGHKFEDCDTDVSWWGGKYHQHLFRRTFQPVANGWARQRAQSATDAPRGRFRFLEPRRTPRLATKTNPAASLKSIRAARLRKLRKKQKRKEKLAARQAALANGVLVPA